MFLDPFQKVFGMKAYPCGSEFPLGTFPEVFHRPGALRLHTKLSLALSIMFVIPPAFLVIQKEVRQLHLNWKEIRVKISD
ncbi:Hypothetical predicted protein [Marmota monax]|uniref:Uncharacterized protein n=1 Tax=Marmota monax TaxID=9995 RepID=A0A5E4CNV4_MARMO|nr:hypothetical protein GHT09_020556 [Marmota monax]VTJ83513.1 Hypothetical predicted protein [Marmota monax]